MLTLDELNDYLTSLNCPDPLERLNQVIPWEEFRTLIEQKLFGQKQSRVGRKPFDVILMFKILILQSLYSLSDAQTNIKFMTD